MIFSKFLPLPFPPRNHPSEKLGPPPSADASSWSFAAPSVEPISYKPSGKNDKLLDLRIPVHIWGVWTWNLKSNQISSFIIKSVVSSSNPWKRELLLEAHPTAPVGLHHFLDTICQIHLAVSDRSDVWWSKKIGTKYSFPTRNSTNMTGLKIPTMNESMYLTYQKWGDFSASEVLLEGVLSQSREFTHGNGTDHA